jgi:hypothetical protein
MTPSGTRPTASRTVGRRVGQAAIGAGIGIVAHLLAYVPLALWDPNGLSIVAMLWPSAVVPLIAVVLVVIRRTRWLGAGMLTISALLWIFFFSPLISAGLLLGRPLI